MKIVLVQPPFTQLNAPYPAVHYLKAFLNDRGFEAEAWDLGIELFRRIYSRAGLDRIFRDVESRLAAEGESFLGSGPTRDAMLRFLSERDRYVEGVDDIVSFLAGDAEELGRAMPGRFPRGPRVSAFLEGRPLPLDGDGARIFASLSVEDLQDFIRYALDEDFGITRYAESKAASQCFWAPLEMALGRSYILREHFLPLLRERLSSLAFGEGERERFLLGLSVPFPGCLLPALSAGVEVKRIFGDRVKVIIGGGYPSTELRNLKDPGIFRCVDLIAYDKGLAALLLSARALADAEVRGLPFDLPRELPRTARLADGRVLFEGFADDALSGGAAAGAGATRALLAEEGEWIKAIRPRYSRQDMAPYLRFRDEENPMRALWGEGKWLKYMMAWGCYWRRCAFCDTSLDYVAGYAPQDPAALHAAVLESVEASGCSGVHFVDEAMPPYAALRFALRSIALGRRVPFWGNFRLEPCVDADFARLLAAGGMVAASSGLESGDPALREAMGKGPSLEETLPVIAALKDAGIMVHAYMIYGFPGEGPEARIDSMEALRQLLEGGLLDSAFWHRFVLTRHSPLYRASAEGRGGSLHPIEPGALCPIEPFHDFADNDLGFRGEEESAAWTAGLDAALDAWMAGEGLAKPLSSWFRFRVPAPRLASGAMIGLARREARGVQDNDAIVWVGPRALPEPERKPRFLYIAAPDGLEEIDCGRLSPAALAQALESARPVIGRELPRAKGLASALGLESLCAGFPLARLRDLGLCAVPGLRGMI